MLAGTEDQTADSLIAFALPRDGEASEPPQPVTSASATPKVRPRRFTEADLKAAGPPIPDGDGKDSVVRVCTVCHGTGVFSTVHMGRVGWENEIQDMVEKGASATPEELRKILDYMVRNFGH